MSAPCKHPNPQRYRGHLCHLCFKEWRRLNHRKRIGYDAWWDQQHGLCALCDQPMEYDGKNFLDHCHRTGRKRGLVHPRCNVWIGGFEKAIAAVGLARVQAYIA